MRPPSSSWFRIASASALAIGVIVSSVLAWTNDDAYISFRYADHLLRGLGLVFNPGERVEGYSNFLWTLWCALGMRLGAPPETWANVTGIACFGATIACLVAMTRSRRAIGSISFPLAALGLALHHEAAVFATGGLETALFTLLPTAGCAVLTTGPPGARRAALAGALFALAALTRPDGLVLAALAGAWLLWDARARPAAPAAFAAMMAVMLAPYMIWKLAYYGDLLPNTYYAKSANLAWWPQGLAYVRLYLQKYGVLAVGLVVGLVGLARRAPATPAEPDALARRQLGLALVVSVGFVAYVARVGGDFMFGRFLVPVTPLMLVALEIGIERLALRPALRAAATAAVLLALTVAPDPFTRIRSVRGIFDEHAFYPAEERHRARAAGEALATMGRGLPLRVAFFGSQAILAYYSRVPVAIEAEAGLTDRFVAHQRIAHRGRVGHEKSAPWSYVIDRRRAHLALKEFGMDSLAAYVPLVFGRVGTLPVVVLTWDPPVIGALVRRGAQFEDFPARLDSLIARMPSLPDSAVRAEYGKLRRFYFRATRDSAREAPFRARLDRAPLVSARDPSLGFRSTFATRR